MTPTQPASSPPGGAGGPRAPRTPGAPSTRRRARNALVVASIALVVASAGLVLGAMAFLRGGGDACRTAAWDSEPAAADLPAGWSVTTSQVGMTGLGVSLTGTATADASSPPAIYLTVSCYGADAAGVLDRSRARIETAGQAVTDRSDLGDGGYGLSDAATGALAVHFRRRALVAYAATSGIVSQADLDRVASALDAAMGRALGGGGAPTAPAASSTSATGSSPSAASGPSGGAVPSAATPPPGGPTPSAVPVPSGSAGAEASPGASPEAAPELIAILPTEVAGTSLTRDSAVGADVLGSDAASRALAAAIRGLGASPDHLRVAQAYDESGTLDLYLLAFRVEGVPGSKLAPAIRDTWLSAGGSGVATKTATIGGKAVTTVDYGDKGATAYIRVAGDAVVVLETADAKLAAEVVAALP